MSIFCAFIAFTIALELQPESALVVAVTLRGLDVPA